MCVCIEIGFYSGTENEAGTQERRQQLEASFERRSAFNSDERGHSIQFSVPLPSSLNAL